MAEGKKKKSHRPRQAGAKANKKKEKKARRDGTAGSAKGQNPKAFGRSSAGITARIQQARKAEIQERKLHVPLVDRSYAAEEPPPIVVAVVVGSQSRLEDSPRSRCRLRGTAWPHLVILMSGVGFIQGPPGVGETTLIKSLVKHYTRHVLSEVRGPINCISGKVLPVLGI